MKVLAYTTNDEIDVRFVRIIIPLDDEDGIPERFPMLINGVWCVVVDIESGNIPDWPADYPFNLFAKVCDRGRYQLLGPTLEVLAWKDEDYVPHGVVPGQYRDYVKLDISADGTITNWPKEPDVGEFFD